MLYHVVDNHLLSSDEYAEQAPAIIQHLEARASNPVGLQPLVLAEDKQLGIAPAGPSPDGFEPVGQNLPLTIEIRHVYTGKFPERGFAQRRGDLAIVSGVKSFTKVDASARAVNFLEAQVAPHTHMQAPTAFSQGTPVVLYSPAVLDSAISFGLEFAVANTFAQDLIDHLSGAFQTLAGIPVLLPAAGYLLGAGQLLKLSEGVVAALYQSQPPFNRTEVLRFVGPGAIAKAGWLVVCNTSFNASAYQFNDEKVGLVDKDGKPYDGDEPYVVLSIDGRERDDLKGFSPQVASAAVLQKFFQTTDGAMVATDTLVGAIGVYSDLKYRNDAEALQKKITAETNADKKAALQKQYDAAVANIVNDAMKPSSKAA